ncbi:MAG: aldo/keto reductase [Paludibacteraceae bacterium]|nr:aldo/keto reductase [Paludibacteraceae bacterium]
MQFNYTGHSGLQLPQISLGLWHNFGSIDNYQSARKVLLRAWNEGITHFDLANNYGPEAGSAERNFGRILHDDLLAHRDEMVISTKAGYYMWEGPYGDGGSRKYLIASIDQSLQRMGLDYVDIFYSHRYDPHTPLEETMQALVDIVRSGKALYAGISNYPAEQQQWCYNYLREAHVPCLIGQYRASLFQQQTLFANLPVARQNGSGFICFSPLAQGLLTDKYLKGIPAKSRANSGRGNGAITAEAVTEHAVRTAQRLNTVAQQRGQSLAQMALAWLLAHEGVTSVLVGASSEKQIKDNVQAIANTRFTEEEMQQIDHILQMD